MRLFRMEQPPFFIPKTLKNQKEYTIEHRFSVLNEGLSDY